MEELASSNRGGKAEAEWTYRYRHDPENPLTEKPKYFFIATGQRCKEAKSGNVEIGQNYRLRVENEKGEYISNTDCVIAFSDGSSENTKTDAEGCVELMEKVPGIVLWIEYTREGNITERLTREKNI
jgi:hypothetical protein